MAREARESAAGRARSDQGMGVQVKRRDVFWLYFVPAAYFAAILFIALFNAFTRPGP